MTRTNSEGWSCTLSCTQNWSNVRFTGQSPFIFDSNYTYGRVTGQMLTPVLQMYRMNYKAVKEKQWKMGFSYGWTISGQNSATTYMWSPTELRQYPLGTPLLKVPLLR